MLVYQRVTNVLTWKTSMGKNSSKQLCKPSNDHEMHWFHFFFKIGPKHQSTCSGWVHIMPPYCLDVERVVLLVVQICVLILWYVWQIIDPSTFHGNLIALVEHWFFIYYHAIFIGKPSISMDHLYHGYVSHNQRVFVSPAVGCCWWLL